MDELLGDFYAKLERKKKIARVVLEKVSHPPLH